MSEREKCRQKLIKKTSELRPTAERVQHICSTVVRRACPYTLITLAINVHPEKSLHASAEGVPLELGGLITDAGDRLFSGRNEATGSTQEQRILYTQQEILVQSESLELILRKFKNFLFLIDSHDILCGRCRSFSKLSLDRYV